MQKKHNVREKIACAILAGGQNRRMGRHKAFLDYCGRTFIEVILDNMNAWFDDIFIVTNDKELFLDMPEPVYEDIITGRGPLGALYTALSVTGKEGVFCIACDMPFSYDALIRRIIRASRRRKFDCFIPRGRFGVEPLFGIYRTGMRDLVKNEIDSGQLQVCKVLEKCRTFYIDIHKQEELININTLKEYIRYAGKIKDMA